MMEAATMMMEEAVMKEAATKMEVGRTMDQDPPPGQRETKKIQKMGEKERSPQPGGVGRGGGVGR